MNNFQYRMLSVAAFFGISTIIMGAMGAHFFQKILSASGTSSIETGVRYQMYHALAILVLVFLYGKIRTMVVQLTFYFFAAGTFLFSFSLFTFAIMDSMDLGLPKIVFLVTPLGGILLAAGWAYLLFNGIRHLYTHKNDSMKD